MSSQRFQQPFIVRREDGFVGVEVDVNQQLNVEETRLLAWQLLLAARHVEVGPDQYPMDPPAWLVWERANDGGRPYLRAIDLSEDGAEKHVTYLKMEARVMHKVEPDLLIEETRIDHLYAAQLMEALRKRSTKR